MKIYLASPGIDTGVFPLSIYIYPLNLLFSYYDLSGLCWAGPFRQQAFTKITGEKLHENQNKTIK